ncbi:peptidoglycan D,D-transpeptidase FtsI family protein [Heyndrickxia acidicola]|uniref:serine-type D-Ala-D-Ala carboxypeptidase n=1 Tax=Heyndrickxia acidicola TaxID=209389 RepID=A0ABU6ML90_9BACI|nr:penicillin-binding protein 2 [Heyndrickxia acidicola]MED1205128.1 penicillin-binding protein 2 [Heyndrickxia acidicola]
MQTLKKIQKKKRTHVPSRMNMLFFIVFILFSVLILRLGIIQIVNGEDYKKEVERTEDVTVNTSVPRGEIFDRNGTLIVGNKPLNAITYARPKTIAQRDMLKLAEKLSEYVDMDKKEMNLVTLRDRKDYWILKNPQKAANLVTRSEMKNLDNTALYHKQLSRIAKEDLYSIHGKELKNVAIFREMLNGYPLFPHVIKNHNVSPKEYAEVSENLSSLPGINTTTDWERVYPFKAVNENGVLESILGTISSSKEGLPKELLDYYLAHEYSRNDRIGKSYLEYEYEDVLQGHKQKMKNITGKDGGVLHSEIIRPGRRGYDLMLSIDVELQKKVEKILQNMLIKKRPGHRFLDRAFVTMMNPNTGEILAMAGKQLIRGQNGHLKLTDAAFGNLTTSYSMGSVVKGATLLAGYQTGALKPGEVLVDQPLKFRGTKVKKSWVDEGMGPINDLMALKRSSNVYMFRTAMKLGGQMDYIPDGHLRINKMAAIRTLRKQFAEFGLGVKTGIDLPGEQAGFGGMNPGEPGKVLDYAIGQYDTYTPLQIAQYMSVIANGGYRIQPHIAKEIHYPGSRENELGSVAKEMETKILNRVEMKPRWIERIKEGLRKVTSEAGGTAYGYFDSRFKVAGKTGTAQGLYDGPAAGTYWKRNVLPPMTWNTTFAGYAPFNHPEVVISVVIPWAYEGEQKDPHLNLLVGNKALKAYYDLKKQRVQQKQIHPL